MAQDVVVNGTTYPGVETVALQDANGNVTMFYPDAVRYVEQSLTPEQQAQARQNIGAGGIEVKVLSQSEFDAMSKDDLATQYNNGVRLLLVSDETNLVPSAISPSGSVFNGSGFMNGYRLNSSGEIVSALGAAVTGLIPYTYGKTIQIEGGLNTADTGGQYVAAYDASGAFLYVNYLAPLIRNSGGSTVCTEDNVFIHTIKTDSFTQSADANGFKNAKFIRVSLNPCIGKNLKVRYI